jgi:hypothetical protein
MSDVRRAYVVTESRRGYTEFLVFARTCKEAVDKVRQGGNDDVEAMDWQDHPAGIQSVRREPREDR